MNRVAASIMWAALTLGCTADDSVSTSSTSTNEQALECKPEGHPCKPDAPFCDSEMPAAPMWKKGDTAPSIDRERGYAVLIELENGRYLAALSDVDGRKIVWARTLQKQQLGSFIDTSGIDVALDLVRPPPRPPVGPGGGDWNARFILERSLRGRLASEQAFDALDKYSCDPDYCPQP